MGSSQQFSLRWNNYLKHITSAFDTLRSDEDLVDVTLSCEGKRIRAHKMLLSACSTYFRDLFKENPCQHPVIIFRNVKFDDLAALVDFIYQGEVNVVQEQLDSFMTTAELLAVQGLTDGSRKDDSLMEDDVEIPSEPEVQLRNMSGKVMTNDRGRKSPGSPLPYYSVDSHKAEMPPSKRRRCKENSNSHSEKNRHTSSPRDSNNKADDQVVADPVEIIPLMPNLKLEMPEYLEQDGSSCSYEEQSTGENSKMLDDSADLIDSDNKPDITQTFYSNQSTDNLDASKSSDIGYLLSKPGTSSGDRISHESLQGGVGVVVGRKRKNAASALIVEGGGGGGGGGGAASAANVEAPQVVMQGPGRFSCSLCGSVYKHLASLTQHLEVHRNQTTCILCHTTLSRRTDLRRHMRLKHNMQLQKATLQRHRGSKKELNS